MKRTELLVFLLVMAIAVGFRFVHLDSTPPGLYPDEAMNGNNALHALSTGEFKLFYPENNGREGLFINLQALSIHFQGNTTYALRSVSALIGVLTVLGTYLLTRRMFDDWRIAAIAALLMATGFWHVNFSRMGFRAIMSPFMAVWGFYYLYKGIETHRIWHWAMAGLFFGLGVHTYIAFRLMPAAVVLVLAAYWWVLRKTFFHGKYAYARHQMLGGIACMIGVFLIVILPLVAYFVANPADFSGRAAQVSVLSAEHPLQAALNNTVKTLGMFFIHGDGNWRHNLSTEPILFWPVAAMFAVGLAHSIWRIIHSLKTKGHPGVPHVLLLAWFGVGLLPGIISNEGIPHALRTLTAAPAVYIMAAMGVHWFYTWLRKWYAERDMHKVCLPGPHGHRWCAGEGELIVGIATIAFLTAMAVGDGSRYFVRWANSPNTAYAFNVNYVQIANRLNALPPAVLKFVIVNADGVLVTPPGGTVGIPMPSQTVMYLTDTWDIDKQAAQNLTYLTREQYNTVRIPKGAVVIPLEP